MDDISKNDLNHIIRHSEECWRSLAGARVFFTGGTGLFGVWFLEAMGWAQKQLNVKFDVVVLSRDPDSFLKKHPWFTSVDYSFLKFHQGDVVDFEFPQGEFSHVFHGATTSALETFQNEPAEKKFNTLAAGTKRVLELARVSGGGSVLFTSSGVAYGKQPEEMPLMLEEYVGLDDGVINAQTALGQGKRAAEKLCASYGQGVGDVKIARCFSFVGPHLPLEIHYAIGNFISDGLAGRPIHIRGDGKPVRSYLYMADLVIWLMTIWLKGQCGRMYNVGSEAGFTIEEIARKVALAFDGKVPVEFAEKTLSAPRTSASDRYVPSTKRAREELGLREWIGLDEGICRTVEYYQRMRKQ